MTFDLNQSILWQSCCLRKVRSIIRIGTGLVTVYTGYYREVPASTLKKFDDGIKGGHPKLRQSWLRFIVPHMREGKEYLLFLVDSS